MYLCSSLQIKEMIYLHTLQIKEYQQTNAKSVSFPLFYQENGSKLYGFKRSADKFTVFLQCGTLTRDTSCQVNIIFECFFFNFSYNHIYSLCAHRYKHITLRAMRLSQSYKCAYCKAPTHYITVRVDSQVDGIPSYHAVNWRKARHQKPSESKANITDIKGTLKEQFDILGNTHINFLAESQIRKSIPLSWKRGNSQPGSI